MKKAAITNTVETQNAPLRILHGDSAKRLGDLATGSVQLVVTSPPYDDLRTYGGHSWDFEATALQLARVLCDGGICCWNVGDSTVDGSETVTSARQKVFFKEECGFRIHDTMIWHKANFSAPSRNRYHQVFEYVFVLSKGAPRCFNPIKDKPNAWAGPGTFGKNTIRVDGDRLAERPRNIISDYGMRGNVWYGNTRGQEDLCRGGFEHPAMMPKWLARDLILSWSNPDDTILDPFAGSGTTGRAALENGRRAVLIEINAPYLPIIERSCSVTMGLGLSSVSNDSDSATASY